MGLISNGSTVFDNGSMASGFGGNLNFISKATASASASIEFTSGIDSTYKEYVIYFVNLHPATNNAKLQFNFSTDSGSNYNVTKTTTHFDAGHAEDNSAIVFTYEIEHDLAQSTSFQDLTRATGNANDSNSSGYLHLFNPSSTTFVKHYISSVSFVYGTEYGAFVSHSAGYGNTQNAVDAIQFKYSSGNIDAGEILLFGVN